MVRLPPCLLAVLLAWTGGQAMGQEKTPRTFQMDGSALARVKARLPKDAAVQRVVTALRKKANKALDAGPFTIVRPRPAPAPSGNPHDYVSLAPYWWPDPEKKDGKPYLRKDGQVNPERNKYDAPLLSGMSQAVDSLALAYYFTGEAKYAQHARKLLRAWFLDRATRMDPNLKYGQFVPGRSEGRAEGIIETRRFLPVIDAVALLEGSAHWTKADQEGMRAWSRDYLRWLRTSKIGKAESAATNNHGTWYDVQVVTYALFAGEPAVAKAVLEESKTKRIARQIEPDGRQPRELGRTKSFGYTVFNLRAFFALASLGEREGVDLWRYRTRDGRSIRRALDWVVPFATGEKKWEHKQIGKPPDAEVADLLRRAARVFEERRYEQARELLPEAARREGLEGLLWPAE